MSILKNVRALIGCAIALVTLTATAAQQEVNVVTDRTDFHLKPLFKQFETQTGIKVNAVFVEEGGLPARLTANPDEADAIITTDASVLSMAKQKDWIRSLPSSKLVDQVRPELKDPEHKYVALSFRARDIVYSADRVAGQDALTDYADLAKPENKGKVCMRPLTHPYNVSLVSQMIADRGESFAREWVKGVAANLAVKPSGNDRKQGELIANGTCDLSLMNTYLS